MVYEVILSLRRQTIAKDAADGNYYVVAGVDGKADAPEQEEDTEIVHSSASPVFKQYACATTLYYFNIT